MVNFGVLSLQNRKFIVSSYRNFAFTDVTRSSEMNCSVQVDDEFKESPIPEQFVSKWNAKTKSLETNATELVGV